MPPLGLYVHVPFCASTCDFCAFYQEKPRRDQLEAYLAALEAELERFAPPRAVETVFFGGGTPGLLPAGDLRRLCRAVRAACGQAPAEWTVEMAPSTVKADKVRALLEEGVTRLSMGVQSFDGDVLEKLGRLHSPRQVEEALRTLRGEGVDNLNLDLIIATPGQSRDRLAADIDTALEHAPEHLSAYCLTFEEDTKLYARFLRGEVRPLGEEAEADLYAFAWQRIEAGGLPQYEVSNFARPGRACRHNVNTWQMAEWLGYGPSASSQHGGRRWTNTADLDRWREGVHAGAPVRVDEVKLTPDGLLADCLLFGLRRNEGVDLEALRKRFPQARLEVYENLWADLEEAGHLSREGARVALTLSGRLLADRIGVAVLEASEPVTVKELSK